MHHVWKLLYYGIKISITYNIIVSEQRKGLSLEGHNILERNERQEIIV